MAKRRGKTAAGTRAETRAMVRTAADERAVKGGCLYDPERAAFACDWVESYCRLYEGDKAGEPLTLLPFQRDFLSRLFGWVRPSREWGQLVRRFTHGAFWAAKKNGKSPLAAAVNLYLLCGDGEPGQKVYQAAKNGDQAKIAQRHAVEMVKQSPELLDVCKVNNSTMQVAHLPSASVLTVLTGDDSRGAKAKEGLNGSVTFDEMHVVDREMYERVSRAGISRKEPLILSYSTAGDDPSSIGFERCQYGRQVNAGERDDAAFLHVEYAADEKATEADIDANVEALGKAANPAWGAIVKPTEFMADWERSKGNPREAARCKQYRFNLWVGSTNPWLDKGGWEKGGREYTLADLAGRECYLGMDMARRLDMAAAVFVVPWPEDGEEAVRLWPLFWMPRQTAVEQDHLFPLLTWGREGGPLRLTDGGTLDYGVIKRDVRAAIEGHGLRVLKLFFDPYYANELTQALHEGESLGGATVPGVVAERVEFGQTIANFAGPAAEFERRVKAGDVHHPRNEVMTWQVGHCEAKVDVNQNVRPVKPAPGSGKKVDGVVAAVMPCVQLLTPAADSYYSPHLVTV